MPTLLAIDGNSILNRAFYGIRPLTASDGLPTNAVYGFVNILNKNIAEIKPDYLAVAFDVKKPTFRHEKCDYYKANRHGMPDELAAQLPFAKDIAAALGCRVIESPGYEADDVLGTLAKEAAEAGCFAYILTGDRDSFQLIGDNCSVLFASNKETQVVDTAAFSEKYGIRPDSFVDVKALMGDSSDNIPGVAGIGEKTALKLVSDYGSLDGLYEKYKESPLSDGVKKKLEAGKDSAYESLFLVTIVKDAPTGYIFDDLRYSGGDSERLRELYTRLEFTGLLGSLGAPETEEAVIEDDDGGYLSSLTDGIYSVFEDGDCLYISDGEKTVRTNPGLSEKKAFFENEKIKKILLDSKKTRHTLDGEGIALRGSAFDVSLAAYVLDASQSRYEPETLSLRYLSHGYNGDAAKTLFELYKALDERLDEGKQRELFEKVEMPVSYVLFDMEKQGFLIDREGLNDYGEILSGQIESVADEIYLAAGCEFNINSPKQLGEVLFEKMGLPTFGKKGKNGWSTAADVIEKLRPYNPIIDAILEYRMLTKLKSTYVDGLLAVADENGIVHTTFNQTVTATGRLSSTEPNLQNIPVRREQGRILRRFFKAHEGRVLIDADYSQIELRLLAAISGDETMTEAFRNGVDIHTVTASQVFRVPEGAVTPEMRKRAKAVNFGIVYGIGEFSLSEDIGVSRKQAGEYIKGYLATYPSVDAYLKGAVAEAYKNGYVETLSGRRRYISELTSAKATLRQFGERVAMNSPIQGTAADVIKIAMVNTYNALEKAGISAKLILQIHDELIVEADEGDAEKAKEILRREMENAIELSVPLTVEVNSGKTWYDTK